MTEISISITINNRVSPTDSNYNYNYDISLYSAALQCCPGAINNVTHSKT